MKLPEGQLAELSQFGAEIGEQFVGMQISAHDVVTIARRKTPAFLRERGITGNHDDRQTIKDFVTRAAMFSAFPTVLETDA